MVCHGRRRWHDTEPTDEEKAAWQEGRQTRVNRAVPAAGGMNSLEAKLASAKAKVKVKVEEHGAKRRKTDQGCSVVIQYRS